MLSSRRTIHTIPNTTNAMFDFNLKSLDRININITCGNDYFWWRNEIIIRLSGCLSLPISFHSSFRSSTSPVVRMVDPLMEAMTQSGIIDGKTREDNTVTPAVKMSTIVLPKRLLLSSRSTHSSWLKNFKAGTSSKRDNTYLQSERLSSGVQKKVKLNNNEGSVTSSSSQFKPANYELRSPVLRRIFAGTFHTGTTFNVQVGRYIHTCRISWYHDITKNI